MFFYFWYYKTVFILDLHLASIQANLKIFLYRFIKIKKNSLEKTKDISLKKQILKTNQIKKKPNKLAKQIKLKI